ncbi:sugar ABC transporter permease [Carboxydochorda subterranea]|uniref:Sugar ABC transporter permease n=1 Tax=Carboxydichorda subterranea TaxID=3109565 RepID=A0ABZ1BXS2_9FIRM|nr:sugar ABC transporter permease [Limnochorda sp. L945t]WRP17582.1 sugar ABC transporter permease [Limnochorda sp. L945t]
MKLSNFRMGPPWVGLANYERVLADAAFWRSIGFSLEFATVTTLVEVGIGLAIALFFWSQFRSSRAIVSLMLLPMMTAPSLLAIMFRLMLNDFVGIVPVTLQMFGLPQVSMLGPDWVWRTLVAIDAVQWTPFVFLLIYTGLQGLPEEIIEAASVDGASTGQTILRVIVPQLSPTLAATAFLRFIDTFRIFDSIYVLTGGGPGDLTTSASIYIYKQAFGNGDLGVGIAAAVILLTIIMAPVGLGTGRLFRAGGGERG